MPTMRLYSSNPVPVPVSFISPLAMSASVSCIDRVMRISREMP